MKTIRRLYFYAVAFISVEVVLWGMVGLLRSIFNHTEITSGASNLAQALSLILVGVPIFLIHWLWAQRVSAKEDEENSASVRAIFLYGILLGTLIPVVQNLLALINRTFLSTANLYSYRAVFGGYQSWSDNLIAIVINLLVAAYFWNILKNNWSSLTEAENFSDVRRLYRFVWVLYSLLLVVYGAQLAIDFVFTLSSSNVLGEIGRETAINAIALLLIGTPIWVYSWRLLQDALTDSAEKDSYLRLGILYLLTLGGVIIFLIASGNLIYQILLQILGVGESWSNFLQEIGGPISLGLPFGVLWAYYGKWLKQQFDFDENLPRRESKQRLYFYILSLLGLSTTVTGLLWFFRILIDLALDVAYLSSSGFADPLSAAFAMLFIGLPTWLLTWYPMQSQSLGSGELSDYARRSDIRKFYLYLVLFASVIGGMASAGALIFHIIDSALGGTAFDLQTILNSLIALALFVVLFLYHSFSLRKDSEAKADLLEEKQSQFHVLVFDHNGTFGESVKGMFAKRAPKVPVTILNLNEKITNDMKANLVVLSGSLAVNTPENVEAWIRSFKGNKLVVSDEAAGVFWMNDFEQAADSAKAMAEGQEIRPQSLKRMNSIWTYVAYIFAGLFACQLLVMLLFFGVSMVAGF